MGLLLFYRKHWYDASMRRKHGFHSKHFEKFIEAIADHTQKEDLRYANLKPQKAYGELEREGVIYSLKGRGSFVGSGIQELRMVQQQELIEQIFEISGELCELQVPQQEVLICS